MQMINEIELLENNKIYVAGVIAKTPVFNHQIYGESFYNVILEVQRLSKQTDMVPILISDHLLDIDLLKPKVMLEVNGQVRSYNNIDKADKKRLVVNIFAREAKIIESFKDIDNFNDVFFDSFICKDPNFRVTPFGREICDLLVAVNRAYKKSDYIPCICWGRNRATRTTCSPRSRTSWAETSRSRSSSRMSPSRRPSRRRSSRR